MNINYANRMYQNINPFSKMRSDKGPNDHNVL